MTSIIIVGKCSQPENFWDIVLTVCIHVHSFDKIDAVRKF